MAFVAEALLFAGVLDLPETALEGALGLAAGDLFVEIAIELRYHPAS